MGTTTRSREFQKTPLNQFLEITFGGGSGYGVEFLVIRICQPRLRAQKADGVPLPLIKPQLIQSAGGESVAPEGDGELVAVLSEVGLRQAGILALAKHIEHAGAGFVDVVGEEEDLAEALVAWNGTVGLLQFGGGERGRQLARVPNRDPVGKNVDLHTRVGLVVAVSESVDDDLGNGGLGDFVGDGVLRPGIAHTDPAGEFGHDEIGGLIDQLKEIALEDLIVGDGFDRFVAVEVEAFDLGSR